MKKEKEGQNVAQAVMEEGERCPSPPHHVFFRLFAKEPVETALTINELH